MLAREAEDAFVKGEPAPAHPARPEASPIGTDTGACSGVCDAARSVMLFWLVSYDEKVS